MSKFSTVIKIGRPRLEVFFAAIVDFPSTFSEGLQRIQSESENLDGELFFRVRRRNRGSWTVTFLCLTSEKMEQVRSILYVSDEHLSFIFANQMRILGDKYITSGVNTVKLSSTPQTLLGAVYKAAGGGDNDIISSLQVFNTYAADGAPGGTDFFAGGGGSYDAATRILTLDSSPGPAGTEVFINWGYNGSLITPRRNSIRVIPMAADLAGDPIWNVSLTLEGA